MKGFLHAIVILW